jgi:hypothetical protein
MPGINEQEKQRLIAISTICRNFSPEKFRELTHLAYSFSYMQMSERR